MKAKLYLPVLVIVFALFSCDPTTPPNPNEQEVVTAVQITCTSPTDTVEFGYSDPDGTGGLPPSVDTAFLTHSNVYSVSLELLDETKTPVDTLTNEIEEEAEVHQFFFTVTLSLNLTSAYGDLDGSGHPVGLINSWTTGTASTGSVVITLRHEPDKSATGVSAGDITNAGGETDIEITFPVVIQ